MIDTRENYEMLAAAVVGQACEDYCYALRKREKYGPNSSLKNDTLYKAQIKRIEELEEFFFLRMNSFTYETVDPVDLIHRLKEVAADTENYKVIRFLKNHTKGEDILKEE